MLVCIQGTDILVQVICEFLSLPWLPSHCCPARNWTDIEKTHWPTMNSETGNSDSYLITDSNIEEPSENGIVNPLYDDTNSPIAGSQQHAVPERPNIQEPVKLDINGGSGLRGESSWLEEGHVIHAQHNIQGASPSVIEMPSCASAEMQEIASDSIQRFPEHTHGNQDSRSEKNRSRKESKCFQRCPPWRVVLTCVACFTVEFTLGVSYTAGTVHDLIFHNQ